LRYQIGFLLQHLLHVCQDGFHFVGQKLAGAVFVHVDDLTGGDTHAGHADGRVHGPDRLLAMTGSNPAEQILHFHRTNFKVKSL